MNGGRLEIKSKTTTLGFDLQKVADFKYVNGSASVSAIGEDCVFSLSQLSPGVYAVSVNNTSFKMTR